MVSPFTMVVRGGASPCCRPRRSANAPLFPLAFALVSLTTAASFACYHIHQCSQWGSFNAHQVFDASPSLYDVSDVTLEDVGLFETFIQCVDRVLPDVKNDDGADLVEFQHGHLAPSPLGAAKRRVNRLDAYSQEG
jgi:hypothetical protein